MRPLLRSIFLAAAVASTAVAHRVEAATFFALTPDAALAGPAELDGCAPEPGVAHGALTPSSAGSTCHTALIGSFSAFAGDVSTEAVAVFEGAPLSAPMTIGRHATLVFHYWSATGFGSDATGITDLAYALREKHASGLETIIAAGSRTNSATGHGREEIPLDFPAYTLEPGSRLQVVLASGAPEARVLFGDRAVDGSPTPYAESGITFEDDAEGDKGLGLSGGPLTGSLLGPLLLVAALRRRA